ncbi:PAC2 family protein [Helcobacillus massiliensis]|uniref:PAC2 family protein n=1 Tax=Helcobacillus massiliensis TaxID=521392 RepID=A0A839QRJ8_9MICO|nr:MULTISPECIES: PAC2 family protein [Helcobacillus]MBB3022395.1 hypothetical protein [Helcobacillus massiliensis]MCG7426961.1 PAC2 family protein [Helcobacillus sp. ACRRO]MCT1557033.1 PAC2 family protein [Helcobacillus massiliensis]MCT2035422.1 PAC2 family protein [Helcobacillus massiliensis]MCT2331363.1 PAC2 family protein [Helcobacillus massiliensis]
MLDPTTLFSYERDVDARTVDAPTMLVTLGSYTDSGHVQATIDEHILSSFEHRLIGTVDADQVIDYTAVRPGITLDADRLTGYEAPRIELHEVSMPSKPRFLLLRGPEPNYQWERTAHAIRIVTEQLGVTRTVLVSGFPTATPHTRPTPVTTFAPRPEDLTISNPMPGPVGLRSAFPLVLAMRLAEADHAVVGLAAHIPSYAHEVEYFPAVLTLLSAVETAGGPAIEPSAQLEEKADGVRRQMDAALESNEQLQTMIGEFEANYARLDGFLQQIPTSGDRIPGAEELSEDVEEFLRRMSEDEDNGPTGGGQDTGHSPA